MSPGVVNSVIIGGESILGSQSNYVYIGGSLNINNSYTFPNIDGSPGELLSTDGLGNINWSSSTTSGLSEVLSVDNNSGINYIIMGTSTGILSSNGDSQIYHRMV
jgi:hypothetical protein